LVKSKELFEVLLLREVSLNGAFQELGLVNNSSRGEQAANLNQLRQIAVSGHMTWRANNALQ
jgi:hypothetical protein